MKTSGVGEVVKHTPSPWELSGPYQDGGGWHYDVFGIREVAGEKYETLCCRVTCFNDARLIAAAPTLLEIAEDINESATDGRDIPEWLQDRLVELQAAIKLAKGEGL